MPAAGVIPDEYTFSNLIMVCKKDSEKALRLMRSMEQTGLEPGSVAYNAAIVACGNGDQPDQAVALLNEMRERGVQVTEGTYSAAIAACGKAHRWEQALSLLEDIKDGKDNLEPNEYCYHACISGTFYSFRARGFLPCPVDSSTHPPVATAFCVRAGIAPGDFPEFLEHRNRDVCLIEASHPRSFP